MAPLFVEHPQFPIGLECGCLLYFGIGLHFTRGHFTYDPRTDRAVIGKACDAFGRVKNYPGLYVNHGALIPGSAACANPAFTVAALAERNIERILAEDF